MKNNNGYKINPKDKLHQTDMQVSTTTKKFTPAKGPGSYNRKKENDWKKNLCPSALRIVQSFIKFTGPASPGTRQIGQGLVGDKGKDIQEIRVEPTGKPNQMGYVTNDLEEQGVVHLPEQNIKKQLQKAQPGIDPQTLKEQQKTLIEDVIIPHEQAHIQDSIKGDGEFSPQSEQIAEKEEDWTRMQGQWGLSPESKFAKSITVKIDEIANKIESIGLVKEATILDIVSNALEAHEN